MTRMEKWRHRWLLLQTVFYRYFGRNYRCGCGHAAKWKTAMVIHGQGGVYRLSDKKPKYCPACWAKAAIKCAWCGNAIMPGDAVTLYTPNPHKDFKVPDYAVMYKEKPHLQLVGCLRWDCAETGADRAGFWVMPGKVQRVASPIELVFANLENGGDGIVITGDLTDPSQAIPLLDEPKELNK